MRAYALIALLPFLGAAIAAPIDGGIPRAGSLDLSLPKLQSLAHSLLGGLDRGSSTIPGLPSAPTGTAVIGLPTGTVPVPPQVLDLLKKLGQRIGGLKKPAKASEAVDQLKAVQADLEATTKEAVAAIKAYVLDTTLT